MKRYTLHTIYLSAFVLLAVQLRLQAQDYKITFSGSGTSSAVETVEVKNLNQGTTVTLNGTDTLHLVSHVGVNSINSPIKGMEVYPNPMTGESKLMLHNTNEGMVSIIIYDMRGEILLQSTQFLQQGVHTFVLNGLGRGVYFITAKSNIQMNTHPIISLSSTSGSIRLSHIGNITSNQPQIGLKNPINVVEMQYNETERLLIDGIAGLNSHKKTLVPTESQNIDFEFIDCIDADENQYGVITIGTQIWMSTNLRTTHYLNGAPIYFPGEDNNAWQTNTTGAYAYYNNSVENALNYGLLYNWHAVNNSNEICPENWIVPANTDYTTMLDYAASLGFENLGNTLKGCRQVNSPEQGECATNEHPRWNAHSNYGTDMLGFSMYPNGYRSQLGTYFDIGRFSYNWTSTEFNQTVAFMINVCFNDPNAYQYTQNKAQGTAVRCKYSPRKKE